MYSEYIDSMTAPYMHIAPVMTAVAMLGGAGLAIFGIISSRRDDNNTEVKVYLSSGSTEKVFCRNCGRMGLVSSNFCPGCGIDQRQSSNASKHCTHCGTDVSSESAFCGLCGWKF
jgi:RNA polymerase subunit RPABC4/transcription elongation factor Spt4